MQTNAKISSPKDSVSTYAKTGTSFLFTQEEKRLNISSNTQNNDNLKMIKTQYPMTIEHSNYDQILARRATFNLRPASKRNIKSRRSVKTFKLGAIKNQSFDTNDLNTQEENNNKDIRNIAKQKYAITPPPISNEVLDGSFHNNLSYGIIFSDEKEKFYFNEYLNIKYNYEILRYHLVQHHIYAAQENIFYFLQCQTIDFNIYQLKSKISISILNITSLPFEYYVHEKIIIFDIDFYAIKGVDDFNTHEKTKLFPVINNNLTLTSKYTNDDRYYQDLALSRSAVRPMIKIGFIFTNICKITFLISNIITNNVDHYTDTFITDKEQQNILKYNNAYCISLEKDEKSDMRDNVDEKYDKSYDQISLYPTLYETRNNNYRLIINTDGIRFFDGYYGVRNTITIPLFLKQHNKLDLSKTNYYIRINNNTIYDMNIINNLTIPQLIKTTGIRSLIDYIEICFKGLGGATLNKNIPKYDIAASEFFVTNQQNIVYANIIPANSAINKSIIINPVDTFATTQLCTDNIDILQKQKRTKGSTLIANNTVCSLQVADIYNFLDANYDQYKLPLATPRPFSGYLYSNGWSYDSDVDIHNVLVRNNRYKYTENIPITSKQVGLIPGVNVNFHLYHEILISDMIGNNDLGLTPYVVTFQKSNSVIPNNLTLTTNFSPDLRFGSPKLKDIAIPATQIVPIAKESWLPLISLYYQKTSSSNDYRTFFPSLYYRLLTEFLRAKNIEDGIYNPPIGNIAIPNNVTIRIFSPGGVLFTPQDYQNCIMRDDVFNINLNFAPTADILNIILMALVFPNGGYNLNRITGVNNFRQIGNCITLPTYNHINIFYNNPTNLAIPVNVNYNYTSKEILALINQLIIFNNDVSVFNASLDLFIATQFLFDLIPKIQAPYIDINNRTQQARTDSLATYGYWKLLKDETADVWLRALSGTISLSTTIPATLTSSLYSAKDLYNTFATRAVCNYMAYCTTLDSLGLTCGVVNNGLSSIVDANAAVSTDADILIGIFSKLYQAKDFKMSIIDVRIRIAMFLMFGFTNSIPCSATIIRDKAFLKDIRSGRYVMINYLLLRDEQRVAINKYTPITYPFLVFWRELQVLPTTWYVPLGGIKTDYIGKKDKYYNVISNNRIDYIFNRPASYNTSFICTIQSPDGHLQYNLVEWENNIASLYKYLRVKKQKPMINTLHFTTRTRDAMANYIPIAANIIHSDMYSQDFAIAHQAYSVNYGSNAIDCVSYMINSGVYNVISNYDYITDNVILSYDNFSPKMLLFPNNEKLLKDNDPHYHIESEVINYVTHNISSVYNPTTQFLDVDFIDDIDLNFEDFIDTNKDINNNNHKNNNSDDDDKNEKENNDNKNDYADDNRKNKKMILEPIDNMGGNDKQVDKIQTLNSQQSEKQIQNLQEEKQQIEKALNIKDIDFGNIQGVQTYIDNYSKIRDDKIIKQSNENIPISEKATNYNTHMQNKQIANNLGAQRTKPPIRQTNTTTQVNSNF